jgi:anaerobic ribonucleoside-triphosphate reductase activating protein
MERVNVAETCVGTGALGPGRRSVVWVQGCPLRCHGCVAPDWIPRRPRRLVEPDALAAELLADPTVDGLTLSGGEPMVQARPLAAMVRAARRTRPVNVVCFSGFTLEALRHVPGAEDLLAEVDVLVDGPYVEARDDGRGLRGSDNQRVHHLTDRLRLVEYDFTGRPRGVEVRVRDREVLLVGVPPAGLLGRLDAVIDGHIGDGHGEGPR